MFSLLVRENRLSYYKVQFNVNIIEINIGIQKNIGILLAYERDKNFI